MSRNPTSEFSVEVFADQDAVSDQDVIELWMGEAALDLPEARRRLREVLVIATDRGGQLAGIGTAYLQRSEQLRATLWHYRTFVAPAHRQSSIALTLALTARDHLQQRYVSGEDRRAIGIIFEIESEILKRFFPQAVWPRTQFAFIGENAIGGHVRVYYFPGVHAPEPA